jgi:hypothetical protein
MIDLEGRRENLAFIHLNEFHFTEFPLFFFVHADCMMMTSSRFIQPILG